MICKTLLQLSTLNSYWKIEIRLQILFYITFPQIGEYLGENREPNLTVLRRFVERFEFAKMDIVTALRAFLGKFRLPGEAQKVT